MLGLLGGIAAGALAAAPAGDASAAQANTLTRSEVRDGWKLLFDGKSTTGWRGVGREAFPEAGWVVEEGWLKRRVGEGQPQSAGDLLTVEQFESFDLRFEWRIAPGANSGVKYGVLESRSPGSRSALGMEYQIWDDAGSKTRDLLHGTGALYDLLPADPRAIKPAGSVNQSRILVRGRHLEHWLNGRKIVECELGSPRLLERVARSKYREIPGFGESAKGHISLQDHGGEVWFRSIKLRPLGS